LVIDGEDDDPLFSLLDHLISLAVYDDAFEATSAKDVENMFWVKMPPGKKSLTLKWKRRVLDLPVFRERLRGVAESGTSPTEPLRAQTWIRYLKRLGQKAGFQHSFTQYGLRRGLLNVVNSTSVLLTLAFNVLLKKNSIADLMHLQQTRPPLQSEIRSLTISREQLVTIWTRRSDLTPKPATWGAPPTRWYKRWPGLPV
jgi:hypothetical protein